MSLAKTTTTPTAGSGNAPGSGSDTDSDSKSKMMPSLHPVPLNDSPLAVPVSLGRVAVLLGLLAWNMDRLVRDPVSALWVSLPVVAIIQMGYLVVCVPPAGSSLSSLQSKASKKKRSLDGKTNSIWTAILALVLTAVAVPAVYAFLVLFGAPFLAYTAHTALCGAHLALVGVLPVVYARGLDRSSLVAVVGASAPLDETFGAVAGAVGGAWLGAVPIPLDWDRDWQAWPVTIVVGVYVGATAGSLLAGSRVLFGKRMGGQAAAVVVKAE